MQVLDHQDQRRDVGAAPQRIAQQRHDQSPFSGWIERRSHLVTEELEQQRDPGFAGCR